MPPLGPLSEAELQVVNDPTRSVKRAQLATLCRKASLKVKGTNADLIAALNAAVYNKIDNRENVDPLSMNGKNEEDPFRSHSMTPADEKLEQSFDTVIHYNTDKDTFRSESTPARTLGRKCLQRKSMKRKSNAAGLYPQVSVYPDLAAVSLPTTSNQDFAKAADSIMEEMNSRIAVKQQGASLISSPPQTVFKDIVVPLTESPFLENTAKHRFSDAHNKLFDQMPSVKTHYAAHRENIESPDSKSALPTLRISKRNQSTLNTEQPSPKRMRHGADMSIPFRFVEGRREESMSEQGRDIQNLMRQEFQHRMARKLGISNAEAEAEDSIEVESRHLHGKVALTNAARLHPWNSPFKEIGKVIPQKAALATPGIGTGDTDDSLYNSRELIKAPTVSAEEPSIILVPGREAILPKDKKIPVKHADVTKSDSRALIIPAAKTPVRPMRKASLHSAAPVPTVKSQKPPIQSPIKYANFTMGSIPTNPVPSRRKSLRTASQANILRSPTRPIRMTRSVSANTSKGSTIRYIPSTTQDMQVPVKFDGGNGKGKRKYKEVNDSSPTKRMRLNQGTSYTPVRKENTRPFATPSTALVRYTSAGNVSHTPGTISSRTPITRVYGNGRSAPRRPPWR